MSPRQFIPRPAALAVIAFVTAACHDAPTGAGPAPLPGSRPLGLIEVTITGVGTQEMRGTATAPSRASLPGGPRFSLSAPATGDGSIQLQTLSSGSFTQGTRGAPGAYRYLWATYRVRNAQVDGTPYSTARQNLTFLAAATTGTVNGTAISNLQRFDGSAAAQGIATQITPAGYIARDAGGQLIPLNADVLQVITNGEADSVAAPAGVTTLPYGFVVRNASTGSRSLAASPAASQYDGVVTFAFKVPLQASAANDPFTISAIFLAMDDDATRITQSLEEQSAAGEAAFLARATAIGATTKTVLPGSRYAADAATTRTLCTVRTAGPSGSPTAYLVQRDIQVTISQRFSAWPLRSNGSVARDLSWAVRDAGGAVVTDVPLQVDLGAAGVLERWGNTGVRMLPRSDRVTTTVTATACEQSASTIVHVSGFSTIAAGDAHTLAISRDGSVSGWGDNGSGQVTGLSGLSGVVQVSGGDQFSLTLKADGTVRGFGWSTPATIPGSVTDIVQISAGSTYGMALRRDGTVYGWGTGGALPYFFNVRDALGPGHIVQIAGGDLHQLLLNRDGTVVASGEPGSSAAVVPGGLANVVQVSAGKYFSLALKSDGTVVGWGSYATFAGLTDVVQVAAGYAHALALKSDGTVVAWGGGNYEHELDVPPGLSDVVQIAGGIAFSMALKSDGTVVCWGRNAANQRTVPVSLVAAVP